MLATLALEPQDNLLCSFCLFRNIDVQNENSQNQSVEIGNTWSSAFNYSFHIPECKGSRNSMLTFLWNTFDLHNLIAYDRNASFPEQQGYPFLSWIGWPCARCAFCTPCSCSVFFVLGTFTWSITTCVTIHYQRNQTEKQTITEIMRRARP